MKNTISTLKIKERKKVISSYSPEETTSDKHIMNFINVCVKLDELRFKGNVDWGPLSTNIFKNRELSPSKRLFLLWLCSLIDQFYRYTFIWTKGEKAMLELLADEPSSFQDIKLKIDDDKCIRFADHDRFILVRDDYTRIKNTFEYLSRYGQTREALNVTFIRLLAVLIARCQGKNGTAKLAYYLDERLFSKNSITHEPDTESLASFLKKPRKRLWMFVMFLKRDPAVMNLLHEALLEVMGKEDGQKLFEVWQDSTRFDPKEVDLPGDMWNRRLFSALLSEFPSFRKGSPKTIARKMAHKYDISPSVFDVTFKIGANKCGTLECHDCPFGENLRCHKGSTTQCSLVDWLTRSQKDKASTACDPEGCPIAFDRGKRLCIHRNI